MAPSGRPTRSLWSAVSHLEAPIEAIGFWAAVGLPIVYLSMLVSGIDNQVRLVLFLGLIGLNFVALIVGHDYEPPRLGRSRPEPR